MTNTVTLAHYSVLEYLISPKLAAKQPKVARFAITQLDGTRTVTTSLLSYIFYIDGQLPLLAHARLAEGFALLDYASMSYFTMSEMTNLGQSTNGRGD